MMNRIRKRMNRTRRDEAQGMVEYILIVGLIAILVYAAVNSLGSSVKDKFNAASHKVSGMSM